VTYVVTPSISVFEAAMLLKSVRIIKAWFKTWKKIEI